MNRIVIMGVRSTYELDHLRSNSDEIRVLAVKSQFGKRFERLKSRGKPEDPKTIEDFKWLNTREKRGFLPDKKEEKYGVVAVMKQADHSINNNGSIEYLEKQLDRVIKIIDNKTSTDELENIGTST